MKHASQPILNDVDKMGDRIAAEIRRVSGADVNGTSPRGANRPLAMRDMLRKVAPHRTDSRPDPKAPPIGAQKPPSTWPSNPVRLESGMARPGSLGSMPSREAPRR